jgi:hypothetical protein
MASNKTKADTISDELCVAVEDELTRIPERETENLAESKRQIAEAKPAHSRTNAPPSPGEAGVPTRYSTEANLQVGIAQRLAAHPRIVHQANASNASLASRLAQTIVPRLPSQRKGE